MSFLLYLAKPTYGGWVSFTAHLALKNGFPLYKISKRSEKNSRPYGYNVSYNNISLERLKELVDEGNIPVVTAIDKNFYHVLEILPDNSYIVIHDPTEFNKVSKKVVLDNLKRFRVITIRQLVSNLLNNLGINNQFIIHPYVSMLNNNNNNKKGAISISRIDYDKNTDIIVKANQILEQDGNYHNKIEIYGDINERYIYQKLKDYDSFKTSDEQSMYRGRFPKDFNMLKELLVVKKYVVDMSSISMDGGGTQYTFLEAIDAGCVLILNKKWTNTPNSIWKDGYNCYSVSNEYELANLLNKELDTSIVKKNANNILKNAINVNWDFLK